MAHLGGMTACCSQAILPGLGSHAKQTQDLLISISDIMEVSKPPFNPYHLQSFQEFHTFCFSNVEVFTKAVVSWSWASGQEDH